VAGGHIAARSHLGDGDQVLTEGDGAPAAVLVQDTGGGTTLDLAIADPTQQHVGTIRIELARPASKVLSADHRVSIERLAPTVRLSVNVAQAQGLSIAARLAL